MFLRQSVQERKRRNECCERFKKRISSLLKGCGVVLAACIFVAVFVFLIYYVLVYRHADDKVGPRSDPATPVPLTPTPSPIPLTPVPLSDAYGSECAVRNDKLSTAVEQTTHIPAYYQCPRPIDTHYDDEWIHQIKIGGSIENCDAKKNDEAFKKEIRKEITNAFRRRFSDEEIVIKSIECSDAIVGTQRRLLSQKMTVTAMIKLPKDYDIPDTELEEQMGNVIAEPQFLGGKVSSIPKAEWIDEVIASKKAAVTSDDVKLDDAATTSQDAPQAVDHVVQAAAEKLPVPPAGGATAQAVAATEQNVPADDVVKIATENEVSAEELPVPPADQSSEDKAPDVIDLKQSWWQRFSIPNWMTSNAQKYRAFQKKKRISFVALDDEGLFVIMMPSVESGAIKADTWWLDRKTKKLYKQKDPDDKTAVEVIEIINGTTTVRYDFDFILWMPKAWYASDRFLFGAIKNRASEVFSDDRSRKHFKCGRIEIKTNAKTVVLYMDIVTNDVEIIYSEFLQLAKTWQFIDLQMPGKADEATYNETEPTKPILPLNSEATDAFVKEIAKRIRRADPDKSDDFTESDAEIWLSKEHRRSEIITQLTEELNKHGEVEEDSDGESSERILSDKMLNAQREENATRLRAITHCEVPRTLTGTISLKTMKCNCTKSIKPGSNLYRCNITGFLPEDAWYECQEPDQTNLLLAKNCKKWKVIDKKFGGNLNKIVPETEDNGLPMGYVTKHPFIFPYGIFKVRNIFPYVNRKLLIHDRTDEEGSKYETMYFNLWIKAEQTAQIKFKIRSKGSEVDPPRSVTMEIVLRYADGSFAEMLKIDASAVGNDASEDYASDDDASDNFENVGTEWTTFTIKVNAKRTNVTKRYVQITMETSQTKDIHFKMRPKNRNILAGVAIERDSFIEIELIQMEQT